MGEEDRSSVWSRYVEAKRQAFGAGGEAGEPDEPRTIEELEEAIARAALTSGIPETGMPPRATVHPSATGTATRWFYRTLVGLFAALVGALFWWGNRYR